ncbi:MAG: selenocysteine-specific translation elongation factor [Myxococcota bacterium]
MPKAPRSLVLGTAGHIDHGKTTLVRVLTGTDTDRLPEEKRRGITIELGFAPWRINKDLEASIVDVPGHENFVRTMVAGAGGIDAVILVVSAEDGVMPQTREHINVCRLLGVKHGVIALSKVDRLEGDEEAIELAADDVREALEGTIFEDAPVIPCSAHTKEGIEDLQRAVVKIIGQIPRRSNKGDAIIPLDRVFSIRGHGTVVTGTLLGGVIDVGKDTLLRLEPGGEGRDVQELRTRAAQVRGDARDRIGAGSRIALNLGGIDTKSLSRGDVLTAGNTVARRSVFHVWLRHLPTHGAPWKAGSALQICIGTGYTNGKLDPLFVEPLEGEAPDVSANDVIIEGGREGLVRLRLESPLPVWRGARVVVRAFSDPSEDFQGRTVGGGVVLDPEPSSGRGQRPRWVALGRALHDADPQAQVNALVRDAGLLGVDEGALGHRTGIFDVRAAIDPLLKGKQPQVARLGKDRYVEESAVKGLIDVAISTVDKFHGAQPLKTGMPRPALEAALGKRIATDVASEAIDRAVERGALRRVDEAGTLARPGKGLSAEGELPPRMQQVMDLYEEAGQKPPTLRQVSESLEFTAPEVLELVSGLQRTGRLVRVTADLSFSKDSHTALLTQVRARLTAEGTIDVQALKAMTGLSRKFAVPLMEHFDSLQITVRRGDERIPGPRA